MRTRSAGLKAAIATGILCVVAGTTLFACGGEEVAGPEVTSAPRPTVPADREPSGGTDDGTGLDIPDLTIPGELDDVVGQFGDCSDVVLAYTQLAVTVLEGESAQNTVDDVLARVRPKVPDDLQDDLKVVGDAYAKAARAGLINAASILDEPSFRKANKAIGDWLTSECGAALGGG